MHNNLILVVKASVFCSKRLRAGFPKGSMYLHSMIPRSLIIIGTLLRPISIYYEGTWSLWFSA